MQKVFQPERSFTNASPLGKEKSLSVPQRQGGWEQVTSEKLKLFPVKKTLRYPGESWSLGKAWRNGTAQTLQRPPVSWEPLLCPLSVPGALVTLLEAATLLRCVVYGTGYPRPREGLQSDFWDYLRLEGPLGKWQTRRIKKRSTGQVLSTDDSEAQSGKGSNSRSGLNLPTPGSNSGWR